MKGFLKAFFLFFKEIASGSTINDWMAKNAVSSIDMVVDGKRWKGANITVDHVKPECYSTDVDDYWAYRCLCHTKNGAYAEIEVEEFNEPRIVELSEAEYHQRLQQAGFQQVYQEA